MFCKKQKQTKKISESINKKPNKGKLWTLFEFNFPDFPHPKNSNNFDFSNNTANNIRHCKQ